MPRAKVTCAACRNATEQHLGATIGDGPEMVACGAGCFNKLLAEFMARFRQAQPSKLDIKPTACVCGKSTTIPIRYRQVNSEGRTHLHHFCSEHCFLAYLQGCGIRDAPLNPHARFG